MQDCVFTVITPVFNGGNLLRETLNSVLKYCAGFSFEYLVINDGSTDQTSKILTEYVGRIFVLDIQNQGEANAVNMGLKIAKGKYCLVVSADDPLISSELFVEAISVFESSKEVVAVYPDWNIIDSNSNFISKVETIEYSKKALIEHFVCIPGPGAIFRTTAANKIGGRNVNLKFGSDYHFWLKLSQLGEFKRIPKVLAQWRHHSNSTSINSRGLEMAKERIFVVENFLQLFPQSKSSENSAKAHAYYNAASLAYFSRDIPGVRWMLKAIQIRKGWIEKADLRVVLFCLLLPFSRYFLVILSDIPFISKLLRNRNHDSVNKEGFKLNEFS
jgi:glycosyltransferase involved in cell wall biosynthesis